MTPLRRILETSIYADDLAAAERFYCTLLGLEKISSNARNLFLRVGDDVLLIFRPEESLKPSDVPSHGAHGAGHFAFGVTHAELDQWRTALLDRGIAIEHEHTWPNGARSLYFRDPAGNSVELATEEIWR